MFYFDIIHKCYKIKIYFRKYVIQKNIKLDKQFVSPRLDFVIKIKNNAIF